MRPFLRQFWQSFGLVLSIMTAGLALTWHGTMTHLPPRPALWTGGPSYVSSYSFHGSTSHHIFRFGLFGTGERIRQSDVLLLGSSHVEDGLSAAVLTDLLSKAAGRPVHAYNLGLGFAEGIGFAKAILAANDVHNSSVILDLFTEQEGDGLSDYGRRVDRSNALCAWLKVYDLWLRYDEDWLLDPYLPRFSPRSDQSFSESIKPVRSLGIVVMRDWETGDTEALWAPKTGWMFGNMTEEGTPISDKDAYRLKENPDLSFPPTIRDFFAGRNMMAIFTLVPFDGSQFAVVSPQAAPFCPISSTGLVMFDDLHLTFSSRVVATTRLFGALQSAGLDKEIARRNNATLP